MPGQARHDNEGIRSPITRKPRFTRALAAGLFLCLLNLPASFSQTLSLPSDLGKVRQTASGTNGKTIYLLQEAHVDYEAQKAMVKVLKSILLQRSVELILVEGGWDDMSLSDLRIYGTSEGREKIAERYLRDGKISAEEYLDVVGEFPLTLRGIEDPALYAKNMEAFLEFHKIQAEARTELSNFTAALEAQARKALSKDLRNFEAKRQAFRKGQTSLVAYLPYLAHASGADLAKHPSVRQILVMLGNTQDFDLDKVEKEKQDLLRVLSRKVSKIELEPLRGYLENPSDGSSGAGPARELEFLDEALALLARRPDLARQQPLRNLRAYRDALTKTEAMNYDLFFEEIRGLEEAARARLAKTSEEKEFLKTQTLAEDLSDLFELRLVPESFARLKQTLGTPPMGTSPLAAKGTGLPLQDQGSPVPWISTPAAESLRKKIPSALAFYESALAREEALIRNTIAEMDRAPDREAVVITGGFHTERMLRAIHARGFTVLKIAPRFEPGNAGASQEKYFRILKDKWEGSKFGNSKSQTGQKSETVPNTQILKSEIRISKSETNSK